MVEHGISQLVEQVCERVRLEWRGTPRIDSIRFELGTDQAEQPSVFFTVVLPDDTDEDMWTSDRLEPISRLVKQRTHEASVDRWVYIAFAKRSESDQVVGDDEEADGAPG